MKPFQPSVPEDIQAFLFANFTRHGVSETTKNFDYFELHSIVYGYINWTYYDETNKLSQRSPEDYGALASAYDLFQKKRFEEGYEVLRNSPMYKETYWQRLDVSFNPQSIQSMKQLLPNL